MERGRILMSDARRPPSTREKTFPFPPAPACAKPLRRRQGRKRGEGGTRFSPHPVSSTGQALSPLPFFVIASNRKGACLHAEVALRHAGVAISELSIPSEIASVVSLPRNHIRTQPPEGRGDLWSYLLNNGAEAVAKVAFDQDVGG